MRISDWSSYVCSSDLRRREDSERAAALGAGAGSAAEFHRRRGAGALLVPAGAPADSRSLGLARAHRRGGRAGADPARRARPGGADPLRQEARSEEHTSELQSLMRISYAVFCLKKKKNKQ